MKILYYSLIVDGCDKSASELETLLTPFIISIDPLATITVRDGYFQKQKIILLNNMKALTAAANAIEECLWM